MFLHITAIMIILLTIIMIMISTPIMMAINITILVLLVSLISSMFLYSTWLPFILLMIFITGMMIILLYVSSLATNNKHFTMPVFNYIGITFLFLTMLLPINYFTPSNNFSFLNNTMLTSTASLVYKLFSPQMMIITMLMMTYLLIALFVVVKNVSNNTYPLRLKK
uniref:NADH dehydrogenase subunit 6 n=1 Tax=Cyphocaris challengeri TaxID=3018532 RepID=UPI0022FD5CA8|nr:NADH dehydrogenase subunit 6 [Cyphocaris challengeri]WBQ48839.1 NADH dehydrogenase subunit 6 [Cyphocaris challengeri]